MTSININIKKEVEDIYKFLGFSSLDEFVQDSIQKRILEVKKSEFYTLIADIRNAMKNKKISESEILSDFKKVKHEN